jgi:HSP20 family protein
MRKPSFFERLTGAISPDDYDDLFEGGPENANKRGHPTPVNQHVGEMRNTQHNLPQEHVATDALNEQKESPARADWGEDAQEGELAVDVYQTPDSIVVKALVAGVGPNNIDISLTRDMVTIRGHREEHKEVTEENFFYKELFWGGFARTILLPEEVDVDGAEATTNHGILIIRLPKVNKERQTKLKVKAR